MKRIIFSTACLLMSCSAAHADERPFYFGIANLYFNPNQTIDFLTAAWTVVGSGTYADTYYAVDLDGFTFTNSDTDDQSDPIPLNPSAELH